MSSAARRGWVVSDRGVAHEQTFVAAVVGSAQSRVDRPSRPSRRAVGLPSMGPEQVVEGCRETRSYRWSSRSASGSRSREDRRARFRAGPAGPAPSAGADAARVRRRWRAGVRQHGDHQTAQAPTEPREAGSDGVRRPGPAAAQAAAQQQPVRASRGEGAGGNNGRTLWRRGTTHGHLAALPFRRSTTSYRPNHSLNEPVEGVDLATVAVSGRNERPCRCCILIGPLKMRRPSL